MELVVTDVCMAGRGELDESSHYMCFARGICGHPNIVVASFMRPGETFVVMLGELDKSSNYKNLATTEIEQ